MQTQSATSIQSTKAVSDILESDSANQNKQYIDYLYSQLRILEQQLRFRELNRTAISPNGNNGLDQANEQNIIDYFKTKISGIVQQIITLTGSSSPTAGQGGEDNISSPEAPNNQVNGADSTAMSQEPSASNRNETVPNNANCGEACLLGALKKLSIGIGRSENPANAASDMKQLRAEAGMNPNNENAPTNTDQLKEAAEREGANARSENGTASIQKVKETIKSGGQPIVLVRNSSGGGHFLRVDHIDKNGIAWMHDPENKNGELVPMSTEQLQSRMQEAGNYMVSIWKPDDQPNSAIA